MSDAVDIRRLQLKIAQENDMMTMLNESCEKMEENLIILQHGLDDIDDENNEWKVRHEIQLEINDQLNSNVDHLRNRVETAKKEFIAIRAMDRGGAVGIGSAYTDDVSPFIIRQMDRDRKRLAWELRNVEWRIDKEAKNYYRAQDLSDHLEMQRSSALISIREIKAYQQRRRDGKPTLGKIRTSRARDRFSYRPKPLKPRQGGANTDRSFDRSYPRYHENRQPVKVDRDASPGSYKARFSYQPPEYLVSERMGGEMGDTPQRLSKTTPLPPIQQEKSDLSKAEENPKTDDSNNEVAAGASSKNGETDDLNKKSDDETAS